MPKKRRSRAPRERDWGQVAADWEQERLAALQPPQGALPPPPTGPPRRRRSDKALPPPSAPAGRPPAAAGARRLGRGRLLAAGGLGVTAGGAGLYALHRSRRRKAAVGKQWVTLDGEVVELRKAAPPIALPVPTSRPVRALLPTGRHVSHENDHKHVKIGPRRKPTSALRRYTGVGKGVSLSTTPGRLVPVRRKPPKPSPRETLGKSEGLFRGPNTPALSHYGYYPVAVSGRNW